MGYWIQEQNRLLKSVRIIKAFYESKLESPLELLDQPPVPVTDGDLAFSGVVTSYGLWGFRSAKPLTAELRREMSEMCESLLGGLEALETQRQELERMQLHLEQALNGTTPDNVISLRRRIPLGVSSPRFGFTSNRRFSLKRDCLIEGPNVDEIRKMANELYAQGTRVAFIEYHELQIHQRQSISQLLGFGSITLFVPNILELSLFEQEILRHVILQDTAQRPLLMVGSPFSYSDLRGDEHIDMDLLTLLAKTYVKLTRPFSEYKEQGLLHYFLDSLSESPT